MKQPVLTAVVGTNDQLIAQVAKLYLKPRMKIADVTYGRGVFWKQIDRLEYSIFASDIAAKPGTGVIKNDFRDLSNRYVNEAMDVVVLDPPYMHGGATVKKSISKCYGNKTTKYASHDSIIKLYADGMHEAFRILKPKGTLWVKCQDEIESGKQKWSHLEIWLYAMNIGFTAKDLFVLVQSTTPARRLPYQLHARKNHSYLWIFQKP